LNEYIHLNKVDNLLHLIVKTAISIPQRHSGHFGHHNGIAPGAGYAYSQVVLQTAESSVEAPTGLVIRNRVIFVVIICFPHLAHGELDKNL